jgi:hypothetical protein
MSKLLASVTVNNDRGGEGWQTAVTEAATTSMTVLIMHQQHQQ